MLRYTRTTWFSPHNVVLHLHNLKVLSTISLYTTLAQSDFRYIRTTWLQGSTPAQPESFVDDIDDIFIFVMVKWYISHCSSIPWFSLHLQNMISVAFSFLLCFLTYTYFVLIFIPILSRCLPVSIFMSS